MSNQILIDEKLDIINLLPPQGDAEVKSELLKGLRAKQKHISPKFFYNERGSELYEEITKLEEYYPYRCEKEILATLISKLNIELNQLDIIELGSGDSSKISTLFGQIPADKLQEISYYPVDISQAAIEQSIQDIEDRFELNSIQGMVADFHKHLRHIPRRKQRLICFLGGTIGNFTPEEVKLFMERIGEIMVEGDVFLMGADRVKEKSIIELAYDDPKGVTAEFNKNILNVVNAHLDADFSTEDFEHYSFFNEKEDRIEMHLKAKRTVSIKLGEEQIEIHEGETIHTENSHKYTLAKLHEIGAYGNLDVKQLFQDSKKWFNVVAFGK